jgi:hypothetical protein
MLVVTSWTRTILTACIHYSPSSLADAKQLFHAPKRYILNSCAVGFLLFEKLLANSSHLTILQIETMKQLIRDILDIA